MWKLLKVMVTVLVICGLFYVLSVYKDRQLLSEQIIRLHVVADTDDSIDQDVKLQVRDEVLRLVEIIRNGAESKEEALDLLREKLPELQKAANDVLQRLKMQYQAVVTLDKESFPTRDYDTFSLPAGVYDSLRVTIGNGEGKNWWCVVFPDLCLPAASSEVENTAIEAGFSGSLSKTLTRQEGYAVRFWILDFFGKVQNYFLMG